MNKGALRPRSQDTRERIVIAARRQFAELGYERTTIRSVAAEAKIDPALVMRYFGNKDGLFSSAVDVDLRFPDLGGVPRGQIGGVMVQHFLNAWENSETSRNLPALLRAAATNKVAAKKLAAILKSQLGSALSPVVAAERVQSVAGLVAMQMLGLAYTRYVLRLPAVVGLDQNMLIQQLGQTLQNYIGSSVAPDRRPKTSTSKNSKAKRG